MPNNIYYTPTPREAVSGLKAALSALMLRRSGQPIPDADILAHLAAGITPFNSAITSITPTLGRPGVASVVIGERNPRYMEIELATALRALVLFAPGMVYIDKSSKDAAKRRDYIKVEAKERNNGVTLLRLAANTQKGETVKQTGNDHHDVTTGSLTVTRGASRYESGRREVIERALQGYDENSEPWGLGTEVSREEYLALINCAFRMYDAAHQSELSMRQPWLA